MTDRNITGSKVV